MNRIHITRSLLRHAVSFVAATMVAMTGVTAATELPLPCAAGACGVTGFVTSGTANTVQAGNSLTVKQGSDKAILNWASFNISADGKVSFQQPTANSIALNRIFQQDPSAIFGQLTANGQIYLINANGFLFGATAKVNVGGLIASSLGISDDTFKAGLLAPELLNNNRAALESDGSHPEALVSVAPGAKISAVAGGRILLAAPSIQNGGTLEAPDGQVVLAAGQKVYLQASTDPALRGLVVEVDQGGKAWNQLSGVLSAPRGNISLVGLAVNQDGRISATTTVSANGSVRLEAADTTVFGGDINEKVISSSVGGTVQLGASSRIEVLPELDDTATAVDEQAQMPSQIAILGQQVLMHGGEITAPGGMLDVKAVKEPDKGLHTSGNSDARIRIDTGTRIDLAGSSAELPISANLVTVQLRANELADDPTQRDGALRGKTVVVDARVGTKIANVASAIAAVPKSVAQRTSAGGHATFESEGDVVLQQGATVDVSGGQTVYDGGFLQTTQLVGANGQLYDIGTADPLRTYTDVFNPTLTKTYDKWGVKEVFSTPGTGHYEAGYVQGAQAGSVQFAAPAMVLNGSLVGHAINGPAQRSAATMVSGGQLIIGLPQGLVPSAETKDRDFLTPAIRFVDERTPVAIGDEAVLFPQTLELPVDYIADGGFTDTAIYSNSTFTLPAEQPLDLGRGGSLSVQAPRIDVFSNITASGGRIQLQSVQTIDAANPNIGRAGIRIGDGVTLDVRGQWTSDLPVGRTAVTLAPTLQDGGSISLGLASMVDMQGGELVLGDDTSLRASGGAWVDANNKLTGGKGGAITLQAAAPDSALQIGGNVQLDAFGVQGATGGTFNLGAPRLLVAQGGSDWSHAQRIDDLAVAGGVFEVDAPLFSNYGFSAVNLTASGVLSANVSGPNALAVQSGTTIDAHTRTLQLDSTYMSRATGGTVSDFAQVITLPDVLRPVTNVSLNVVPQRAPDGFSTILGTNPVGILDVQTGASILTDPGATIVLNGVGGIKLDGTLRAQGGQITVAVPSPDSSLDAGFLPDLNIEVGANAVLDASAVTRFTPNELNLQLGKVLAGGSVSLRADRGSVITQRGSLIDIAGTSAVLDIPSSIHSSGYDLETIASAGGSLLVRAPESISLLGDLQAAAGSGGNARPNSGSLEIDLTRARNWFHAGDTAAEATLPVTPRTIQLVSDTANTAVSSANSGLALIGVKQLLGSGIDSLRLEAGDVSPRTEQGGLIEFMSDSPLSLARQIVLDSPAIAVPDGVHLSLSADYISLGNSLPVASSAPATPGAGTLDISARQIGLIGSSILQGAQSVTLQSSGDILLQGVILDGAPTGNLASAGSLTFDAARIYPATATSFGITAAAVHVGQTNVSPGTPLSAGGSIAITADTIDSSGTLFAPFGRIDLNAGSSLTLESGSVTSVSGGNAVIPYGSTELGGLRWLYSAVGGSQTIIDGIPDRRVNLTGPAVTIADHATVDLRGGGDLYAYEWVPGTGGTKDALGANVTPGLYAVLPSMSGQYAPYDPQESGASALQPGASVYLSGGGGLDAGVYPLLPARYALLPGARLIQVQSGFDTIQPGQSESLANGAPVVAGYFTFGNTGLHDAGYRGFAVFPGSYAREIAGYHDSLASQYFPAVAKQKDLPAPALPADAGRLSMIVGSALNVAGDVLSAPASGGRAAEIDVSASNLAITGPNGSAPAGSVALAASVVQSWNAGSLVLGGSSSDDGHSIDVAADTVTVGAGMNLSADQIILVAGQSIDLKSGSSVASNSGSSPAVLPEQSAITLTGSAAAGAALVAVSDRGLPVVQRAAGTGLSGASVSLDAGATLTSHGAISIDAPGGANLAGTLQGKGASWSLASSSIGFVDQPNSTDALQIASPILAQLQQAGAVRLASASAIDLFTPVSLGATSASAAPTLHSLTMIGSSVNNQGGGGSIFGGETLTLQGVADALSAPPSSGTGTLTLRAGELDVGPGAFGIGGFSQAQITASTAVVGRGAGSLTTAGNLTITTPELTAAADSKTALVASNGTMRIDSMPAAPSTVLPQFLGGDLTLSADTIQQAGRIDVRGGLVTLQATQDFNMTAGASIDVSGATVTAGGRTAGAAGGRITATAGRNLTLASGASINVAGAADASAGSIALNGSDDVAVLADLAGGAASGARGGSFSVDAGTLSTGLGTLSAALLANGFNDEVSLRTRSGDLDLAAGAQLSAHRIRLTADTGTVDIEGSISAPSGGQRGSIGLFGGQAVVLGSTGQLHADGSGADGRGGRIELGAGSSGHIDLNSGSAVTAQGAAQKGELLVRAPAVGSDVAIGAFGANLSGVGQVSIEPVLPPMGIGPAPADADFLAVQSQVSNYMATAGSVIQTRLNPGNALPLTVRPGVELQQAGDLFLGSSLDLSSWRFDGAPIDLTVRAGGSITVASTISDGFTTGITAQGQPTTVLLNEPSSSIRLIAGADLASADPLAVAGDGADLTLTSTGIVRTGTGDIDLRASRDVVFSEFGASAYTAGVAGADPVSLPRSNLVFNFPAEGGDLRVAAGRDLIGAPIPTSATVPGASPSVSVWQLRQGSATVPAQWGVDLAQFDWNLGTLGGGDLSVTAGRDALNVSAAASGSLIANPDGTSSALKSGGLVVRAGADVGSGQFYAADGPASLTAGGAFSAVRMSDTGAVGSLIALGDAQVSVEARLGIRIDAVANPTVLKQISFPTLLNSFKSNFYTYGEDSRLSLQSTSGTVSLNVDSSGLSTLLGTENANVDEILPASFIARALQQDVAFTGTTATLYPSDGGQLELFAGRDISSQSPLVMSDSAATQVPTAQSPGLGNNLVNDTNGTGRHAADALPALITAGRDINGLQLKLPKQTRLIADRDISNLIFYGQNLNPSDLMLMSAGRDFVDDINQGTGPIVEIGGPGRVGVLAERNVDLGFSQGLTTVGNLKNPNLPTAQGADLTVVAGLGRAPDAGALSPTVVGRFFNELLLSGREANTDPKLGFSRGYAAIDQLFPGSRTSGDATSSSPYQGDLTLTFSRIYTLSGGTLSLLAPGGMLNVGLANPPASLPVERKPSDLGIVAQGTGDVLVYTKGDVLVNQSRIFTLGGGNILIWSDEGSIDAGRGAKSAISAPPPQVLVDAQGNITLSLAGAVAGSGIRTIQVNPQVRPGNVDLIAPQGTVNAGDAGIGSAGDINIAAQQVIGLDNIQFAGHSTGVPSETSGLGASLSGASAVAASASSASSAEAAGRENQGQAPLSQSALSWLDVFVEGFGEEVCKSSDAECLKRNQKQ